MMGSSMFQGVAMHQICSTRVGSMGERETETSGCCALVVGDGITFLVGGGGVVFAVSSYTTSPCLCVYNARNRVSCV